MCCFTVKKKQGMIYWNRLTWMYKAPKPECMEETEYKGVVNMVKRWFGAVNTSEAVRDWAEKFMKLKPCDSCNGTRLRKESLWFKVDEKNIADLSEMDLDVLAGWFAVGKKIIGEAEYYSKRYSERDEGKVTVFTGCGIDLSHIIPPIPKTLSGGEYQRIRLATQIGSQLQGITYILDEPEYWFASAG